MTRWPTVVEIRVCRTPKTLVMTAVAIMPRASRLSSPVRPCGMAVSRISLQQERRGDRDQRGGADEQADEREAAAVGTEEAEDAAQLHAAAGGVASEGGGVQSGSS